MLFVSKISKFYVLKRFGNDVGNIILDYLYDCNWIYHDRLRIIAAVQKSIDCLNPVIAHACQHHGTQLCVKQ